MEEIVKEPGASPRRYPLDTMPPFLFVTLLAFSQSAALDEAARKSTLPGFCAASFTKDRVIVETASGHARTAEPRPYTLDAIQPVASISKTLIGLALADLALRKKVDLDAPIERVVPWAIRNPRFPETPLTLRQLATHT